jgi:hypothetical protein
MKTKVLLLLSFSFSVLVTSAQVAISNDGSGPHTSAMLDVKSNARGLLIPRMTTAQRINISAPAKGLMVVDTTENSLFYYNGAAWRNLSSANANLWVSAIDTNHIFNSNNGNVGIGTNIPRSKLHVIGVQTLDGSLQFTKPESSSAAMITMFDSATENADRMLVAHSPLYQNWGLQYRDSTDRFDFLSNGESVLLVDLGVKNVGIGTNLPQRKLHVVNGSFGGAAPDLNSPFTVENNTDNYISVLAPAASQRGIYFGDNLNVNDGGIIYDGNTNAMLFRTNGNTNRMSLSSTGNVSIGGNIDVAGTTVSFGSVETLADAGANMISSNSDLIPSIDNSRRVGTSTFRWGEVWCTDGTINTSDARDKTNIRDLDYGIKEIMQLRSARFNWKGKDPGVEKIGLIAQELQKVLPEVVRDWEYKTHEETGIAEKVPTARLGVAYADIIPVLIRGMQQQQVALEAKDKKIEELQLQVKEIQELLTNNGLVMKRK